MHRVGTPQIHRRPTAGLRPNTRAGKTGSTSAHGAQLPRAMVTAARWAPPRAPASAAPLHGIPRAATARWTPPSALACRARLRRGRPPCARPCAGLPCAASCERSQVAVCQTSPSQLAAQKFSPRRFPARHAVRSAPEGSVRRETSRAPTCLAPVPRAPGGPVRRESCRTPACCAPVFCAPGPAQRGAPACRARQAEWTRSGEQGCGISYVPFITFF